METGAIRRRLARVDSPAAEQGFLGADHIARAVIQGRYQHSDPFILMMDDFLDKQNDEPVGSPHPHAGFETVSLLLEGEMGDAAHRMKAGDFQMMTAGSGIVHTETIERKSRMHLLQMWLNLPKKDRWTAPRVQDLAFENVPKLSENGIGIRLYSGSFAGLTSPVQNYVPVVIADIHLAPGAVTVQKLKSTFNAFLYVLNGQVEVGEAHQALKTNQVGWLNRVPGDVDDELILRGGETGGRVILYAGEPQHDPIVSHGPFIADRQEEIKTLYHNFRHGQLEHVANLPAAQRFSY